MLQVQGLGELQLGRQPCAEGGQAERGQRWQRRQLCLGQPLVQQAQQVLLGARGLPCELRCRLREAAGSWRAVQARHGVAEWGRWQSRCLVGAVRHAGLVLLVLLLPAVAAVAGCRLMHLSRLVLQLQVPAVRAAAVDVLRPLPVAGRLGLVQRCQLACRAVAVGLPRCLRCVCPWQQGVVRDTAAQPGLLQLLQLGGQGLLVVACGAVGVCCLAQIRTLRCAVGGLCAVGGVCAGACAAPGCWQEPGGSYVWGWPERSTGLEWGTPAKAPPAHRFPTQALT